MGNLQSPPAAFTIRESIAFLKFGTLAAALTLDRGDDTFCPFHPLNRFAQLSVNHVAVRNDDDRIEHLVVVGIVQVAKKVSSPGDGLGLAAARGELDQILMARSFVEDSG